MRACVKYIVVACFIGLLTIHPQADVCAQNKGSKWRLEVGPVYRGGMDAKASGSSRTQRSGLQAAQALNSQAPLSSKPNVPGPGPNPDNINEFADRSFDDGFVNEWQDPLVQPDTYQYQYDDASQYNDNILSFHRTTQQADTAIAGSGMNISRTIEDNYSDEFNASEDLDAFGLRADAFYDVGEWQEMDLSLFFGVRSFWGMDATFNGSTFKQTVKKRTTDYRDVYSYVDTITDRYDYDVHGLFLPDAGNDPDPIVEDPIPNLPTDTTRDSIREGSVSRTLEGSSTSVWQAQNEISIDLNSKLYQFHLGGTVSSRLFDGCKVELRPSMIMNVLDSEIARHESFRVLNGENANTSIQEWRESESDTSFLLGAGVELSVLFDVSRNVYIAANGGYELIQTEELDIGPNKVEIDPSAYHGSVVIGRRF